jgi:hypothetical protein
VAKEKDDHNSGEYAGHRCVPPASKRQDKLSSPAHSIVGIENED